MKRILKFFFESLIIFSIFFLLIDLLISNTILNYKDKSCKHIEQFYLDLKKNCKGKEKLKPFLPTVNIYTDSEGLRIKKDHIRSNKDKIFVFGSSFIYGAGHEYEKSIVGLLEEKQENFEFYNFSLPYGSPTFHLYKLKKKIQSDQIPKKIILVLSMSDILNETTIWGEYDNNGRPVLINNDIYLKSQTKEKFHRKNFKLSRSIAHKIRNKLRNIKKKNISNKEVKVRTTVQAGYTYLPINKLNNFYSKKSFLLGQKKIKDRVNQISLLSKENKIDFYLAIFPFADTIEYGQKIFNWEEFSKSLCEVNKCKLVNSFENYINYKNKNKDWYQELFFIGDEHFTELGHSILANKLTEEIYK